VHKKQNMRGTENRETQKRRRLPPFSAPYDAATLGRCREEIASLAEDAQVKGEVQDNGERITGRVGIRDFKGRKSKTEVRGLLWEEGGGGAVP
jgi:hypothetical protein